MRRLRSMERRWIAALVGVSVGGACSGDASDRESLHLPAGAPIALSEAPVLVIGERPGDPAHELDRVIMPFLLPNGSIGVPLSSAGTIRIFDQQGEFVRAEGSSGQGPGEFASLAAAWARGDTIEAFDGELNRVTRFVPGSVPETMLLEGVTSIQSGVPGLENGTWILYGVKQVQRSGRDLIGVHQFAPNGGHVAEVLEINGFRRHFHAGGSGPDPISPRSVVRSEGNRVYAGETLTSRITVTDLSTGQVASINWEAPRTFNHGEAVALAHEGVARPGHRAMDPSWTLESFRALNGDEQVPVFSDFLIDGGEFVWVRDYDPRVHATHLGGLAGPGSGGEWGILDSTGRRLHLLAMPKDFEPLDIDADHLIGVRRDEVGVESVRVYRIERSGS